MYAEAPSLPVGTAAWLVPESCAWAAATGPTLSPSWPLGPCRARAGPESCLTSRQARGWGRFVGGVWIQGSLWGGFEHRAGYWWGDLSVPGTLSLEPAWLGTQVMGSDRGRVIAAPAGRERSTAAGGSSDPGWVTDAGGRLIPGVTCAKGGGLGPPGSHSGGW